MVDRPYSPNEDIGTADDPHEDLGPDALGVPYFRATVVVGVEYGICPRCGALVERKPGAFGAHWSDARAKELAVGEFDLSDPTERELARLVDPSDQPDEPFGAGDAYDPRPPARPTVRPIPPLGHYADFLDDRLGE